MIYNEKNFSYNFNVDIETIDSEIFLFFEKKETLRTKNEIIIGELIDEQNNILDNVNIHNLYPFTITSGDTTLNILFGGSKLYPISLKDVEGNRLSFPFINKSHYVYSNVIYKILPIMEDEDTALIYQDFILNLSTISAYPEEDFQKNC